MMNSTVSIQNVAIIWTALALVCRKSMLSVPPPAICGPELVATVITVVLTMFCEAM